MNLMKSVVATLCFVIVLIPISNAYGADTHGTYTGTLTEDANPIDVYIGEEYIGLYSDYRMYEVSLDKDQHVKLRLEVPEEADFDLFVYTEDETQDWSSVSSRIGEDEELNFTTPESGVYKFVVATWSGYGHFTLHWETLGAGPFIPTYVLIGIPLVTVVIILAAILVRRRTHAFKPPAPVYAPTPVPTPVMPEASQRQCPRCGGPLTWIEQYQRWYCYNCREYV